MALRLDDDGNQLSFTEWCDKKFTNMYSHDEFVTSPSRSTRHSFPEARPKMTSAKYSEGSDESHHHICHGRMTPSWGETPEPQDGDCVQPFRSPTFQRGPRLSESTQQVAVGSSSLKSQDHVSGRGTTTERTYVEGSQQEGNKTSRRQTKPKTLKHSTQSALEMNPMKDGNRLVEDGGSSGQESHTSKRAYSELSSPCKKQTRSRKCKKRQQGPGGSPRKSGAVQQKPQAADETALEGLNRTASDASKGAWGSSKVCCVWEVRKSPAAKTKSHKVDGISPDVESTTILLKENTDNWESAEDTGQQTKTTAERSDHCPTVKSKTWSVSRKSKCCRQHTEQTRRVSSGEYEVESSSGSDGSDGTKPEHAERRPVAVEQTAVSKGLKKSKMHKMTGKVHVHAVTEAAKKQDRHKKSPSCPNSGRHQGIKDAEENWDDDKTSGNLAQNFDERILHCSTVKTNYQNTSKMSETPKPLGARRARVPSGEYDIESCVDGDIPKPKICNNTASKEAVKGGEQMSDKGETEQVSCNGINEEATTHLVQSTQDAVAKGTCSTTGKSVGKLANGKRRRPKGSSTDLGLSGSTKDKELLKDENGQQRHKSPQLKASRSHKKASLKVTPEEEKIRVISSSSAKEARLKDKMPRASKEKESEYNSTLPPRDKKTGATNVFTKHILESVLKPQCPEKERHKSAEASCSSRRTHQPGHLQRKSSWPPTKVRLEHIHQAFDSDASRGGPEEEDLPGTSVGKSDNTLGCQKDYKQRDDASGVGDGQMSQEPQPQRIIYQTKETLQAQLWSLPCTDTEVKSGMPARHTEDEKGKSDSKLTTCDSESVNQESAPRIKTEFVPMDVKMEKEKVPDTDSVHNATGTCTTPNDVAGDLQEVPSQKTSRVLEWLGMKDDNSRPNSSDLAPSESVSRKQQKILEPGEVSEDSSDSDESWEQFIAGIFKGNNKEILRSPYGKHPTRIGDAADRKSVLPFRTGFSQVDVKPIFSPGQKNVAAVSLYCVHPSPSQPTTSLNACTWSGPVPDFVDRNLPVTASPQYSSPIQRSSDVNSTIDIRDGISEFGRSQGYADNGILPSEVRRRSLGEYPGSRDGCQPLGLLDVVPAFSKTPRKRSLRDVPPRFLRVAQLKANEGQPVSSHPSSSPGCIYSGGIHLVNPVSASVSQPACTSSATLSLVSPKPMSRSWSSGSMSWPSSISRTPGTITPTRFNPWTREATTPSPWKTHPASHDSSVELSAVVDYPASPVPYIDTHCHIDFLYQRTEFWGTFEKFAKAHHFPDNYAGCLAVFCTPEAFKEGAIWENLVTERNIWAAFGCHPHHAKSYDGVVEENIIRCMRHPKAIALGEIGLDYSNRCTSDRPLQLQVFRRQLQIALQMGKPLVIHSREAEYDTLSVMTEMVPQNYKIHRHCFTGSPQEARNFFRAFPNSFIGLTALVTFPTAHSVHRTASEIPLAKILLETDTPYFLPRLCPRSMRWANPSMAVFVADRIAQLRGIPLDEVLYAVRRNTTEMYGI